MNKNLILLGDKDLEILKESAMTDPLKRSRYCLHQSPEDMIQEMVIAVCRESFIAPHRQLNKSKSYQVIEGILMVIFFDPNGNVTQTIEMAPNGNNRPFIFRFSATPWHTVLSRTNITVFIETLEGPYNKKTEYAPWSPCPSNPQEIDQFLQTIFEKKENR